VDGPALRPDGPWFGLSTVAGQVVRACVESVEILDFLRDLLAKHVGLTQERTFNGYRSPLYINEELRLIDPPQSIRSTLLIVFTLYIRSSSSLASLYFESLPLFGSTSTKGVLDGLLTPRHTIGSLLPEEVPPERQYLGLLQRRRRSTPSWTVQAPDADRPDIHRGGAAPAPRLRTVRASAESTNDCNVFLSINTIGCKLGPVEFSGDTSEHTTISCQYNRASKKKGFGSTGSPEVTDKGKGKNIVIGNPPTSNILQEGIARKALDRNANKSRGARGQAQWSSQANLLDSSIANCPAPARGWSGAHANGLADSAGQSAHSQRRQRPHKSRKEMQE
jgi:hypothetical protein